MTTPESQPSDVQVDAPPAFDGTASAADGPALAPEVDESSEFYTTAPDRSWIAPAATAVVALGSLLGFGVWQFVASREPNRPMPAGVAVASSNAASGDDLEAGPPVGAAADGAYFLPKPPSRSHLLAGNKPAPDVARVPQIEVAAPVAVKPPPVQPVPPAPEPVDPRHAVAVAEFAARITDLDSQREVLVRQRADLVAEQARLVRIIEQGKKDITSMTEKAVIDEVAILAIEFEIDSYQAAWDMEQGGLRGTFVATARLRLPALFAEKARLRLEIEKLRTEAEKTRIRNESSYKQLLTMPPRIKQFGEQAEYLRKQWITDCCDWYGKRTAAENSEAVRLFTTALEKDRTNFGAKVGRAVALVRLGQPAAALADLDDAEERANPFRAEALALRGFLKVLDGNEAKGVAEMGLAVTFDRRAVVPLLLRGHAAAQQGRFPGALADFKAAAAIDGSSADAKRYLALYWAAADYGGPRNLRESEGAAKRAVDLTKNADWQALLALAAAEADAGRFPAAVEHATEASKLTFDTHRKRCLEMAKLFAAGKPLRLSWTIAGE